MIELPDPELTLARIRLEEAELGEVDDFITWAYARNPDGPRLRQLAGYRPLSDPLAWDFLVPAVIEAGLTPPTTLDAALTLARHEMRRGVAGEISPEEVAGNIDMICEISTLDHDTISETPQLWNFCVYRRYLRGAGDVGDNAWYAEIVADIQAEAEFHLGLRPAPPPDRVDRGRAWVAAEVAAATGAPAEAGSLAPALGSKPDEAGEAYALALAYAHGTGVAPDAARAATHYQKAANLGHAGAMNNLACLYDRGEGVPRDRAKAIELWLAAAAKGDARAQCSVGYAHEIGDGLPQDMQQAIAWYRRSADNNCGAAHANLGNLILEGVHLPRELAQAVHHYRRGAELGEARAQYQLGKLYQSGEGVPRDFERAADLFRRAYETLNRQRR